MDPQVAYVSTDSIALAKGSEQVAHALEKRGVSVVRTGSRGLSWAEPCVEVDTSAGTRLLYGNVTAGSMAAGDTALGGIDPLGTIDELLGDQSRLVFTNCGAIDPLSIKASRL